MAMSTHSGMLLALTLVVIFSTLIYASRCPATITCPEGYACIKASSFGHLCSAAVQYLTELYVVEYKVIQTTDMPVDAVHLSSLVDKASILGLRVPHRCAQRRYIGRCRARKPRYYFHIRTLSCRPFHYGGCRGNTNRFISKDECERECSPL